MKEDDVEDWADNMIRDAMKVMNCGYDESVAGKAVSDAMEALAVQAKHIKEHCAIMKVTGQPMDLKCMANAMLNTCKVVDQVLRLSKFMDGQPDSRPATEGSILAGLKDEQLEVVYGWVKENEERGKQGKPGS